jgi:hypothetical protein
MNKIADFSDLLPYSQPLDQRQIRARFQPIADHYTLLNGLSQAYGGLASNLDEVKLNPGLRLKFPRFQSVTSRLRMRRFDSKTFIAFDP